MKSRTGYTAWVRKKNGCLEYWIITLVNGKLMESCIKAVTQKMAWKDRMCTLGRNDSCHPNESNILFYFLGFNHCLLLSHLFLPS